MLDPLTRDAGLRRATPHGQRAGALADRFAGLPDGVTRWRLAAALRAAARSMGLSGPMLRLLEHYIDLTYDQDWEAGAEPVVTRPLIEIADHLGRSERQIRNIERALAEQGLLAWRDSGNHNRKGRRDHATGRLIYAYGPSLAPLGVRAAEILAKAQAARAEIAAGRRLRIAISALRRRIRAGLALLNDAGQPVSTLQARLDAMPRRHPAGLTLSTLSARRDAHEALARDVEAQMPTPSPDAAPTEITAQAEIFHRPSPDTTNNYTVNGSRSCDNRTSSETKNTDDHGLRHVPLSLVIAAAGPEFTRALTLAGGTRWAHVVEAAHALAPLLGVGPPLWGAACGQMGRYGAAVSILLLEWGVQRSGADGGPAPVQRPDAYLRGMIARAEQRSLRLDRSLHAAAQRREGP